MHTAEKDPTLLTHLGLVGEKNRRKLAETFLSPTTWEDYCSLVSASNCTIADNVAQRQPQTDAEGKRYFVDEQRFGPYSLWHHKHFLYEDPAGVLMKDIVDYKLPLGPLGSLAQALFVKKQLTTIFRYRVQALETTYGTIPGRKPELTISAI